MKRRADKRELPPLVFVIFAVSILYYIGMVASSSITGMPIGGGYYDPGSGFGGGGISQSTLSGASSTTSATCSASNCAACSASAACTGASCIWNSGSSTCSAAATSTTQSGSNTPPVCLNFKATPSAPFEGDDVEFLVNMSDNSGLAEALFQTDFGGTTAAPWKDLQKITITGSPTLKFSSYTWSDSSATAGTKIKWRVIAKDINGAGTTCAEQNFTLIKRPTFTEKEDKTISTAIEGRLLPLTFTNFSKHGIKKVSIFPAVDIPSGKLTIRKLIGKPTEVSVNPDGIIYQFYEFVLDGISDANIKNATIELQINSSWISENSVDSGKIFLQRWTGTAWNKTAAKKGTEGTDSVEYSAVSPGLSFFAVTGTTGGTTGGTCTGFVKLTLPESAKTGSTVTAEISGLNGCESKSVYIRANSCSDEELGLREGNGDVTFKAPFVKGLKAFYACVDIDSDGSFSGGGEVDFSSMNITTTATSTTKQTTTTGATRTTAVSSLSNDIETVKTDIATLKAQGKDVEIIQDIINEAETALTAGDETKATSKLNLAKSQVEKLKGEGGGNVIVFVGVGIAAAVAAGAGIFLYLKKKKSQKTVTMTEAGFKGGPKVDETPPKKA
ncbi:MAG: PGF-pre-PGF domain-containing protein [Candidatus Aenigmarchaeota archaeon]|nr:PGF-pre-PGF domain-containing protein [Candidatus Aenigmarchaeota archaeon]